MTENSMFFSNGAWYTQMQFARFLKDIFGHDGVCNGIDNELEVIASTPANMTVQVKTGRSYVQGYIHEISTDPVLLDISAADPVNPRIDRVVLHLDVSTDRSVIVKVLTGTPSASPVAPSLTQTSAVWEIALAKVRVNANTTTITSGNITDERTYMWYSRDNMPKASASEFGVMKPGSGLTAVDGVMSVTQPMVIPHISTTNNGGFAVGETSATIRALSIGEYAGTGSWINVGSQYTAFTDASVYKNYPPFTTSDTVSDTISVTVSWTFKRTSTTQRPSGTLKAVLVSDQSEIGSETLTFQAGSSSTEKTSTFTITVPISNPAIQFKFNSSTYGKLGSASISSGATETTVYYYAPQV